MDPKESASVAVGEFHSGIHGDHISGHSRGIGTSLNCDMVKFYALDDNIGFHGPTSTPEDESEEREEKEEAENKSEEIESTRESVVSFLRLEKAFFFNDIDVLPRLMVAALVVHLAGTREAA